MSNSQIFTSPVEWLFLQKQIGFDPKSLRGCLIGGTSVYNIQNKMDVPGAFAADIDIFVYDEDDFDNARRALVMADYEKIEDKSTDKVFKFAPVRRGLQRPEIHLIHHNGAGNPKTLLSRFDFTFCQAVIEIDTKTCHYVEDWQTCNDGKIIELVYPYKGNPRGTRKRVDKFLDRGFIFQDEETFWETLEGYEENVKAERDDREPVRSRHDRDDRDLGGGIGPDGDGPGYKF